MGTTYPPQTPTRRAPRPRMAVPAKSPAAIIQPGSGVRRRVAAHETNPDRVRLPLPRLRGTQQEAAGVPNG